jgi:hypothetical protein
MSGEAQTFINSLGQYSSSSTNPGTSTTAYKTSLSIEQKKGAANLAPVYNKPSFYEDADSDGKYDRVIELQNLEKKLEEQVALYLAKHIGYTEYIGKRGGEWNDFKKKNDMSGLGLSPGDDNESAGWFYLGDTDTLAECKRAALRDDKLYTRVVHYDPANGYRGNWKYGCYGSVQGSRTAKNSSFNSAGVTTSDRTYWVDTPNKIPIKPTADYTPGQNYRNGWFNLGKMVDTATSDNDEMGLYRCKELAKNPEATLISGVAVTPMSYLTNKVFDSVVYFGSAYGAPVPGAVPGAAADAAAAAWQGYCYAGIKNAQTDSAVMAVETRGVTYSKQTRCLDADDDNNLKPQLVKELQALYEDILARKSEIDDKFGKIAPLKKQFSDTLNNNIYKIQFELQPQMVAYRNAVTMEEGELSMLDNLDSHIQMNSNRHKYVLYVAYVASLIGVIYYILASENDTTYVMYVALIGMIALAAYKLYSYYKP